MNEKDTIINKYYKKISDRLKKFDENGEIKIRILFVELTNYLIICKKIYFYDDNYKFASHAFYIDYEEILGHDFHMTCAKINEIMRKIFDYVRSESRKYENFVIGPWRVNSNPSIHRYCGNCYHIIISYDERPNMKFAIFDDIDKINKN